MKAIQRIIDPINEKAICKLITKDDRIVLQMQDDGFIFSNGYMAAKCKYTHHEIIYKLFKCGHLRDYKNFIPTYQHDFTEIFKDAEEQDAKDTKLLMEFENRKTGFIRLFSAGESVHAYDTDYLKVFNEGCTAKVVPASGEYLNLRLYANGSLIGVVLPVRCDETKKIKIEP